MSKNNLIIKEQMIMDSKEDQEESEVSLLCADLSDDDSNLARNVLSQVAQHIQIAKDVVQTLTNETVYVLDIPQDIKKGLKNGKYVFMERKDNKKKFASIYEVVDGKKKLLTNLTVDENILENTKAAKEMLQDVQMLAIQQQLAATIEDLKAINVKVERIEKGQKDDRFAEIKAGYEMLALALRTVDDKKRELLIGQAVQSIAVGGSKVRETLKRKIEEFEPVPEKELGVYLKMLISDKTYIDVKDTEYNEIVDYFEYNEQATHLLVLASLIENENERIEEIYRQQKDYYKSINTQNLKTIKRLHPEVSFNQEWYYDPQKYVEEEKKKVIDFIEGNYNYISLEVRGNELMEAVRK